MSTELNLKTYKIRFNTAANNPGEQWRILFDDQEILVAGITIFAPATTTKDFVPEINDYKYHISTMGYMSLITDEENNLTEAIIKEKQYSGV